MDSGILFDRNSCESFQKIRTFKKYFRLFLLLGTLFIAYPKCVNLCAAAQSEISPDTSELDYQNINESELDPYIVEKNDPNQLGTLVTKTERAFEGYNLFALMQKSPVDFSYKARSLIVANMEGELIKELGSISFPQGIWVAHCIKFINSTTILFVSENATLWNLEDNTRVDLGFTGHHELEYNPLNNTFFTFNYYTINIDGKEYVFDKIEEYDISGRLVWSLDTRLFTSHEQWCPFQDLLAGKRDITHSNSLFFDAEEGMLYYHARNLNTFYKIDYKLKKALWGLGEHGNFTLFDHRGNRRNELFYHAHSVEKVNENTFILFDNDLHNQTNPLNQQSRLVEITIDETTMTANESWVWAAPKDYFSNGFGDADRLPNGNRLGTFGAELHPNSAIGAKLVEVNDTGHIVWELDFPNTGDTLYSVYRVERFRLKPILSTPPDIQTVSSQEIVASWQTWYNFRANRRVNGSYTLYLNGNPIRKGNHVFEKFWQPANLSFTLDPMEAGIYNLTLVLFDEAGHFTKDSLEISSTTFYVNREGPVTAELGQENMLLQWKGNTTNPVMATLTLDNSLITSFLWNGSNINLDLSLLEIGTHFGTLQFVYQGKTIHEDKFEITVFPMEAPVIHDSSGEQFLLWNESKVLTWRLFDHSPLSWMIIINNTIDTSNKWQQKNERLFWSVPPLNEGRYNVTFIAYDRLGLWSAQTTWLTVLSPSQPIIAKVPTQLSLLWGQQDHILTWEVHGGNNWTLWKNGTVVYEGTINSTKIDVPIEDWEGENWQIGTYNLTLQVSDDQGNHVTRTSWVHITLGDPYANSLVKEASMWYLDGENAPEEPDGQYARLFFDYGNGHITLDMGLGEEILDGKEMDFKVYARGDEYAVFVGNNLSAPILVGSQVSAPLTLLGTGVGNQSFDLADVNFTEARYVQIAYSAGEVVEIDAIEAIYYNQPQLPTNYGRWILPILGTILILTAAGGVIWVRSKKDKI